MIYTYFHAGWSSLYYILFSIRVSTVISMTFHVFILFRMIPKIAAMISPYRKNIVINYE